MGSKNTTPDAPPGDLPNSRKPDRPQKDKKKKRRSKKKNKPELNGHSDSPQLAPPVLVEPSAAPEIRTPEQPPSLHEPPMLHEPPSIKSTSSMSPRRQAIMRYKKSDDKMSESSLIAEVKGNLKPKKVGQQPQTINELQSHTLPKVHVDEKITLFKYKSSKILLFDEQLDTSDEDVTGGRLLGHGEFEVFQLHNGDVTYLSCGPSFIYPLLPKLKIIRINLNQFMLPLVNPERYWRIFINTEDPTIIAKLETVLTKVVKYRNFFVSPPSSNSGFNIDTVPKELEGSPLNEVASVDHDPIQKQESSFEILGQISQTIPDTPPSAPMSPLQNNELIGSFRLASPMTDFKPPAFNLNRKVSDQSLTSAMACFDIGKPAENSPQRFPVIRQPKPRKFSNPYTTKSPRVKQQDEKSDDSMDSLLDEYEENISTTKSFTYTKSRGPSRPISRSSSFVQPVTFKRSSYFHGVIEKNNQDDQLNSFNGNDDFPATSLSEYNKLHNIRSRRSSRSELYTSESNWMEPCTEEVLYGSKLPHSKSNYSIASHQHDLRHSDLNNTYKQIYKSITQRDLAQYVNDRNDDLRSVRSSQRLPTIQQKKPLKAGSVYSTSSREPSRKGKDVNLNSREVYKMISSTRMNRLDPIVKQNSQKRIEQPDNKRGLASRLFGW